MLIIYFFVEISTSLLRFIYGELLEYFYLESGMLKRNKRARRVKKICF